MDTVVSFPENWTPPAELTRGTPREVKMTGFGIFFSIVAVLFLVGSVPFAVVMRNQESRRAERAAALRSGGQEAVGQVLRLWHEGKASTSMVAYGFAVNGRHVEGKASAPPAMWRQFYLGGTIGLRYLPSDLSINHPSLWEDEPGSFWGPLAFAAMMAGFAILFIVVLRRNGRLLSDGMPAPGVVTKCHRVKGGWFARYVFRTRDGTLGQGRSRVKQRMENGQIVCVVYDPEKLRRNCVYPMEMFRVADSGEF